MTPPCAGLGAMGTSGRGGVVLPLVERGGMAGAGLGGVAPPVPEEVEKSCLRADAPGEQRCSWREERGDSPERKANSHLLAYQETHTE